eukprot:2155493-Rhodomonas_salina.1
MVPPGTLTAGPKRRGTRRKACTAKVRNQRDKTAFSVQFVPGKRQLAFVSGWAKSTAFRVQSVLETRVLGFDFAVGAEGTGRKAGSETEDPQR